MHIRDRLLVALASLSIAVTIGAILSWAVGNSLREWFLSVGSSCELVGILLVASPEVREPLAHVGRAGRRFTWRLKPLLRRQRPHTIVASGIASAEAVATPAEVLVTPGPAATTDERVVYLMRQETWSRAKIHELERRQSDSDSELRLELARLRDELERNQRESIERSESRLIELRRPGISLLVLGLVLATVGNLLPSC